MSSLAHTMKVWDDVLRNTRRMSVSWKSEPLSERDLDTFTEAIVMCALHLTDLSTRYGGIGTEREIIAWTYNTVSLDVHVLGSFLSDAITLLRQVAAPSSYSWFKRQLSADYPFVGQFCAPIREALSEFLKAPSGRGFYPCYQFFSFLTHLTLVDTNVDLEPEYEELESYLQSCSYSESMVMEMNSIMREWMKDFSISGDTFCPSHGPGATAELSRSAATIVDKYRYLGTDALLRYVFSKHAGIELSEFMPLPEYQWQRTSKVVFVPKSMKTRRTISKEPGTLMYLQQGVARELVKFIHKHPELSKHVDLRHQEINAQQALVSSRTHRFATIDLSSASDTVTTRLVKAVFRGTPLYPFLVALRSNTVVLPSGKVLRTEKFAPMGSALCFPIETLIFSCAVEYTVRRARRTMLGSFPHWRVYGDDIIVEDPLFWDTILTLGGLGFIPNPSKSFCSPARFRESCGGEGYDGVSVIPMKISRRFLSVRGRIMPHHAAQFEGLIDMANLAHVYQFPLLRAWIIRVILDNPIAPPLFSESGDGALYSPCPDNFRAIRRFNVNWQISEIQVAMAGQKKKKYSSDPDAEQARLFETLRLTRERSGDMFLPEHRVSVPRGSGQTILRRVWVRNPQ